MKRFITTFMLLFALVIAFAIACNAISSDSSASIPPTADIVALETRVARSVIEQITAQATAMTPTPEPTPTPELTPTPKPTSTPEPTPTPKPTSTPKPTPTPEFQPQARKIGPIRDSLRDESYTVEITLKNVQWSTGGAFNEPKPGNIYAIVTVQIKNLGPDPIRNVGLNDFQALDANGRLIDDDYASIISACHFEIVDLIAGGVAEGCFLFETPAEGRVELIYAPYRYEGLKPGRYLSFILRE